MNAERLKQNILRVLLYAVLLGGGISLGAYYHTELTVLFAHYRNSFFPKPSLEPSPTKAVVSESTLHLATVTEPVPLVYSETLDEPTIQEYLKQGAVVLPLNTTIGQPGNVVVTAHSSGTQAFGPYRFAFARLSELEPGNEFSVSTPTGHYTYKVYDKEIVWPHQVDKLPQDNRSTVTLVTCWPLWTNFKRLLVHSELIKTEPSLR